MLRRILALFGLALKKDLDEAELRVNVCLTICESYRLILTSIIGDSTTTDNTPTQ